MRIVICEGAEYCGQGCHHDGPHEYNRDCYGKCSYFDGMLGCNSGFLLDKEQYKRLKEANGKNN
jgi:hypothetical protein